MKGRSSSASAWCARAWNRFAFRGFTIPVAIAVFATLIVPLPSDVRSMSTVDLVLVLALDVSGSVDNREYELQSRGLAAALRHPSVVKAISLGASKQIAITVVQWAGADKQFVSIPWTIVEGRASAKYLSDKLETMPRHFFNSQTDIAGLIEFATEIALAAPVEAARHVIDISGDGIDNVRYSTHSERDAAVRAGMTINGLAIVNETPKLDEYYRHHVIGGPEAFVSIARNYEDYVHAIQRKLLREINTRFLS